jgi:D-alanine-D-alanine ligase
VLMKTVAVIFGGRSTEHDVSIVTALSSVIKPLELTKNYRVEAIYIAKDGSWFWDDKLKDIKLYQSGEVEDFMRKSPKVHLSFENGLTLVKSSQFAGRKMYRKIDMVFPATHGTYGEDGDLMGLLEMANVAYVGCEVAASAIAMDKVLAKQVTQAAGIESTPWQWFYSSDLARGNVTKNLQQLKYPLFVKPAHLGSSIGISKVEDAGHLNNALEVAAHYDNKVIVEQGVNNLIEVTLPIIGNSGSALTPALLEKPLTQPEDFFDFDTKYMQGGKKGKSSAKSGAQGYSEVPAKLPKELYEKAQTVGLEVYAALGCTGIARVDMLIDSAAGKVYFNEVNPLPGGLYAHNWRKAGLSATELVSKLINLAEERWNEKQNLATSFSTNYLKQF